MKLRLINFKCYADRTFTFADGNFTLIAGPSGAGKTTILQGIIFALFGTGYKVLRFGASSCSVELEFANLRIKRSKRPNKLIVNDDLTDAAAQGLIDSTIGKSFKYSSYVSQMMNNSLLSMTPAEKLRVLESLIFDADLADIRAKIQACIQERTRAFDKMQNTLEVMEKLHAADMVPRSAPVAPFEFGADVESCECGLRCELRDAEAGVVAGAAEVERLGVEFLELERLEIELRELVKVERRVSRQVRAVEGELASFEPDLRGRLEACYARQVAHRRWLRRCELEERVAQNERAVADYVRERDAKIGEIEAALWRGRSRAESLAFAEELRAQIVRRRHVEMLRNTISDLKSDMPLAEVEKRYVEAVRCYGVSVACPLCCGALRYDEGRLLSASECENVEVDEVLVKRCRREVESVRCREELRRAKEAELREALVGFDSSVDYDGALSGVLQYVEDNEKNARRLEKLRGRSPSSLLHIEETIGKDRSALAELADAVECDDVEPATIEFLQRRIAEQEQKTTEADKLKSAMEANEKERREVKSRRKALLASRGVASQDGFGERQAAARATLALLRAQTDETRNKLQMLEEYKAALKSHQDFVRSAARIEEVRAEVEGARRQLEAAVLLKQKVLETESSMLASFLALLNSATQTFVDAFFPSESLGFALCPFKEGEDGAKPMINVELTMGGEPCDVGMLSGGQVARLNVALVCALNKLLESPLLMLDEATSSLDEETTALIVGCLNESMSCTMLNISHQATEGIFDHVVHL